MRKFISIVLLATFLVLSVTGIQMMLPRDRSSFVATQKAVPPFYPKGMHESAGVLFIAAGVVHIYLNRKPMKSYLQKMF
jgi:hypothetical protein